jgi:hypothetical protein
MKRTIFAWTIAMLVMAAPVISAQHGGGSPKPTAPHGSQAPKPTTHATAPHGGGSATTHGSSTHGSATTHGGSTTHGSSATHASSSSHGSTTHGSSAKSTGSHSGHGSTKTTTASSTKTTKTMKTAKATKTEHAETEHAAHSETRHAETESANKKRATASTTTTGTSTTTLTPVQQKLQRNTNLASKLQSRLPAGTDLNTAAAGFRNLGQFVAAVNVSNNLGIPFTELKTRMVDQGMSLGQAIQDARPSTTGTTVVATRAESEADVMIRTTGTTTAKTTKTPKKSHGGS